MTTAVTKIRELVMLCERFLGRTIVVVLGIALMFIGLGMGVTMVMLPVGIPLGLVGVVLFLWGLASFRLGERT
jgi:hypothetical protein